MLNFRRPAHWRAVPLRRRDRPSFQMIFGFATAGRSMTNSNPFSPMAISINPQTGHELSGVLGFTANFINPATQYQNGVDMHFDWGASQFLTKQVQVGLVGYAYKDIGCDSGSGNRVGCFQSQVLGVGPQIGYIFPIGGMQGYINLKAYGEFDGSDRPTGWNAWLTLVISPPAAAPPATTRPIITK